MIFCPESGSALTKSCGSWSAYDQSTSLIITQTNGNQTLRSGSKTPIKSVAIDLFFFSFLKDKVRILLQNDVDPGYFWAADPTPGPAFFKSGFGSGQSEPGSENLVATNRTVHSLCAQRRKILYKTMKLFYEYF